MPLVASCSWCRPRDPHRAATENLSNMSAYYARAVEQSAMSYATLRRIMSAAGTSQDAECFSNGQGERS